MIYRELLLGCGYRRKRELDPYLYTHRCRRPWRQADASLRWVHVTTVDINSDCSPDYIMDLDQAEWRVDIDGCNEDLELSPTQDRNWRYRFKSNLFDEAHAYEVLEHLGRQGDHLSFFQHFEEIWRMLRPGGFLCATVPSRYSEWLWGDPGHRRAILPATLHFLRQAQYEQHVGQGPSSDYRPDYKADFEILHSADNHETHTFVLQAVKPEAQRA